MTTFEGATRWTVHEQRDEDTIEDGMVHASIVDPNGNVVAQWYDDGVGVLMAKQLVEGMNERATLAAENARLRELMATVVKWIDSACHKERFPATDDFLSECRTALAAAGGETQGESRV